MKNIFIKVCFALVVALSFEFRSLGQGCSSCNASAIGAKTSAGVSFHFSLGPALYGQSAGNLFLSSPVPNPILYTPAALQYSTNRPDVVFITTNIATPVIETQYLATNVLTVNTNYTYVTNYDTSITTNYTLSGSFSIATNTVYVTNYVTNSYLRQVQAPQGIADLPPPSDGTGYVINFYYPSQISSQTGGIDTFSGNPFQIWIISNPNPANNNSIQFSQTNATDGLLKQWTYTCSTGTGGWAVQTLAGLVQLSSTCSNLTSGSYAISNSVQSASGPLVRQSVQIFTNLVSAGTTSSVPFLTAIGSSTSPQITSFTYYTTQPFTSPLPVKSISHPDGSWAYYAGYDAYGNVTDMYSSYQDVQLSSYTSGRRAVYDYSDTYISGSGDSFTIASNTPRRTIVSISGNEIARNYTVFISTNQRIDIQCVTPGAAWNAANNLYTTNKFYTNAAIAYYPQSVVYPDKTMTTYSYPTNSDGSLQTNITATGQPDSSFTYIVDGTSNYTVVNLFGYTVTDASIDVKSGIILSSDVYGNFDNYGRPQQVTHLDGTTEYTSYACCGLDSTTDRDGVVTSYLYDVAKRQIGYIKSFGSTAITYSNVLDAAGNVLQSIRIGSDNTAMIRNQWSYDLAGERLTQTNALGGVSTFTRTNDSTSGGLIRTITNPDGGTTTNKYYCDGTAKTTTGTAARPVSYVYGNGSGYQNVKAYKIAANGTSNEWTTAYRDMLGRSYETLYAAASGSPTAYSYYNVLGQLTNRTDPDTNIMLYAYNAKGEQAFSILDSNQNNVIDWSGADRITFVTNDVASDNGANVRRSQTFVWSTSANTSNLISTAEYSTDGLQRWNILWNSGSPVVSSNRTVYWSSGYRYQTNIASDGSFTVNTNQYGRLLSSARYDSTGSKLTGTSYAYDAHGRQYQVTDARNSTTSYTFNNDDQITSTTTPSPGTGLSAEVTSNYFDNTGRMVGSLQPDSTTTSNLYYPTGDLYLSYGSRIYPVQYTYDAQGRMATMTTWQNFANNTGSAVTTWMYDAYRGFLTGKTYAGSTPGPSYTYTAGGRLLTRLWARGTNTTYAYDGAGDLASVSYNDGSTPTIVYGYDRRGRQNSIEIGSTFTTSLTYNDQGQVLTESYSGGPLSGLSVTNGYDSLLRRTNLVTLGSSVLSSNGFGYDAASRLSTVSDGTNSATYSYVANSSLVSQITFEQSGATRITTTKQYDNLNRLTSISSANASSTVLDSHNYVYNAANQRTSATNVDGTYWVYQYDALGQVTSGIKYWSDGSVVAGQQFGYGFDNTGNRQNTSGGGDQWGANLRYASYTVNSLNQYTSRTVPGAVDVIGSATNTATVTVNNLPTTRKGNFYRAQVPMTNSSGPVWQSMTNLVILNQGTNDVLQTNLNGNVYLPQTPEQFYFDADGNLTNDGRWIYTWDGENRLVSMTNNANIPTGARIGLTFVYDSKGRRISKSVTTNAVTTTLDFIYDGWNLLASLNSSSSLNEAFSWGTDLSGTMQGAGGVGGLLWLTQPIVQTSLACYDGNGNVAALVNNSNGTISGNYEYGPFGEVIRNTGPLAKANPFRFSTKYQDDETDLDYFGYRYYDFNTGRWLSRDPINEQGFAVTANRPYLSHNKLSKLVAAALDAYQTLILNTTANTHAYEPEVGNAYLALVNNTVNLFDYLGLDCPACDSGIGTHSLPINTPCGLRACAQHDRCYDLNKCSASSWAQTIIDIRSIANGGTPTLTSCEICNLAVLAALVDCVNGKPSSGPMYYCANQHRFITIPGDYSSLASAKVACCTGSCPAPIAPSNGLAPYYGEPWY